MALVQVPPATPAQEAHIQSTLSVAVKKMVSSYCAFPRPNDSDVLVVIGAYEGRSLTTATVAGQDKATMLADIIIESGDHPIYLALSSYAPTIWRLNGDVKRVRQVAVVQDEGAGVVGVAPDAVHFATSAQCHLPYKLYPDRAFEREVPVLKLFGRRANVIGGDEALYRATVTDSSISIDRRYSQFEEDKIITRTSALELPKAGDLDVFLHHNFPPEIVDIDPSAVVASHAVERYAILPMVAGAAALEKAGALIPATMKDIRRWKDRALIGGHLRADQIDELLFDSAYRVTRPIHLPAELCGAFSLTLFVPSRDYVTGDYCHSNIYIDDGTILASPAAHFED